MNHPSYLNVHIPGWAHSRFGRWPATVDEFVVDVAGEALASAEVEAADIGAVCHTHYSPGMHREIHQSPRGG